jgi:hypothetical protein
MTNGRESRIVLIISAGAALFTLLPYLLASRLAPPGTEFSGFILNPIDGFSYLAKMRQGAQGSWSFTLPYAAEPGPGVFLYAYHLLLGHLAHALRLPLLSVYHGARAMTAFLLYWSAFYFLRWLLGSKDGIWFSWLVLVFGSGLSWLSMLLFGHPASDMLIPESIPSLASLINAHFPLALLAILVAIFSVANQDHLRSRRSAAALISGTTLGIVLPFAAVSVVIVLASWTLLEWGHVRSKEGSQARAWLLDHMLPLALLSAALLPWFIYDGWLSQTHPALRLWNAQNQTPSPPPWDYLLGFGPILLLAGFGILARRKLARERFRLLVLWLALGALLLYAPVAFQRRMSMGLFFPLAALAGVGLTWFESHGRARKGAVLLALALMLPTNMLLIGASLASVASGEAELVHSEGELAAYAWLEAHASPGDLILASGAIGNRLPAFTSTRVLYGHPFETPGADDALAAVRALFQARNGFDGLNKLQRLGIEYVFYGFRERSLGEPAWLGLLENVASFQGVELYRVPEP